MRIFLTGATGFLGARILRALAADGHDIAALIRPQADARRIADCRESIHRIEGRLGDDAWHGQLADFRPHAVIHAAWQGVANTERDDPAQADNVARTVRLAALAADAGAATFIGLGSQAEYGPADRCLDETAPTRPATLYGMAKLAAGQMCAALCEHHAMRFAWLRVFSTYGPGDNGCWLIPSVLAALRRGERPRLTACAQRWDFLYGDDAAAAVCAVAAAPEARGVFNLGAGEAPVLRGTVELLRDLAAPGAELGFGEIPVRADQSMHLQADIGRLRGATGWAPRWSLRDGLAATVEGFDAGCG